MQIRPEHKYLKSDRLAQLAVIQAKQFYPHAQPMHMNQFNIEIIQ